MSCTKCGHVDASGPVQVASITPAPQPSALSTLAARLELCECECHVGFAHDEATLGLFRLIGIDVERLPVFVLYEPLERERLISAAELRRAADMHEDGSPIKERYLAAAARIEQLLDAVGNLVQVVEQLVPEESARGVANVVLFQARAELKSR